MINICFILDHGLKEYRLPFFNQLYNKGFNINIVHSGKKQFGLLPELEQDIVKSKNFLGFQKCDIKNLNDFDVVVHMQNIRFISLWILSLNPFRKFKLIHWGIGTSSSKGLDSESPIIRLFRNIISICSDALVLYSSFPKSKFPAIVRKKIFVANNTVESLLSKDFSCESKDSFLFVGTLNERKGLDILIEAFSKYLKHNNRSYKILNIIGDGPFKEDLQRLVHHYELNSNVIFLGAINNESEKLPFYMKAVCCISPKQAGLSVLESFSFGVPFITFHDAISGGEHLNIEDGINGFLIHSENELLKKMIVLDQNRQLSVNLGHAAFKHYSQKRSMGLMVEEFYQAIEFVLKKSIK